VDNSSGILETDAGERTFYLCPWSEKGIGESHIRHGRVLSSSNSRSVQWIGEVNDVASDSRSPKARHRFGFSGSTTRWKKDNVTTDDILASLTRQAELRQKLGEEDPVALEEIAEAEDLAQFQGFNPEPPSALRVARNGRSFGRLAFVVMLLCGLAVVWLYSSISKSFDIASVSVIIQKSGVQSIFANQTQLGIIALAAFAMALWIQKRRRASSVHLLSTT
jgi:hypothetical protein